MQVLDIYVYVCTVDHKDSDTVQFSINVQGPIKM